MIPNETFDDHPAPTRSEVALLDRAVRHQWPIPLTTIENLPERMEALTLSKDARIAIRAAEVLVKMNAANGPAEQNDQRGSVVVYIPDNGRD